MHAQELIYHALDGQDIRVVFLEHPNNNKLLVTLPGFSYGPDAPLLYYAQLLFFQHGYSILTVDYRYRERESLGSLEDAQRRKYMEDEQECLASQSQRLLTGKDVVFLGKSLGCSLIPHWVKYVQSTRCAKSVSAILIAPVGAAYEFCGDFCGTPSLLIQGESDPYFSADTARSYPAEWRQVFLPRANHALECDDDWAQSLRNLELVLGHLEEAVLDGFLN